MKKVIIMFFLMSFKGFASDLKNQLNIKYNYGAERVVQDLGLSHKTVCVKKSFSIRRGAYCKDYRLIIELPEQIDIYNDTIYLADDLICSRHVSSRRNSATYLLVKLRRMGYRIPNFSFNYRETNDQVQVESTNYNGHCIDSLSITFER
jgi:hypothetical protein